MAASAYTATPHQASLRISTTSEDANSAAAILSRLQRQRELTVAWTEITRCRYRRDGLRYASDTTDAEWTVIEPHMPPPAECGRPRGTSLREGGKGMFY